MGSIWAKIWRKQSTKDRLASISEKLSSMEEFKRSTQAWQKKLIGHLILYFTSLYFMAAFFAYFKYNSDPRWHGSQAKLLTPFVVAPVVVWLLKRLLTWWYHRQLRRNEAEREKLLGAKGRLLDEIMEKETYKVAKDLLERYGGQSSSSSTMTEVQRLVVAKPSPSKPAEIRRRQTVQAGQSFSATPRAQKPSPAAADRGDFPRRQAGGPPMPRPVLPRDRGYMDRIVEYLVGDGPNNRYALVCRQCQSHNGMALREEFEYVSYRCCYCFYWNPARKQRPSAPRLPDAPISSSSSSARRISMSSSSSSSGEDPSKLKLEPEGTPAKKAEPGLEEPVEASIEDIPKTEGEAEEEPPVSPVETEEAESAKKTD